jgi:hypothetical protein
VYLCQKTNAILKWKWEEKLEMDLDLLLERIFEEPQELAYYLDYDCTIKVNDNIAVTPKYRKCYSTEENKIS